jgi:hypothetical protein
MASASDFLSLVWLVCQFEIRPQHITPLNLISIYAFLPYQNIYILFSFLAIFVSPLVIIMFFLFFLAPNS